MTVHDTARTPWDDSLDAYRATDALADRDAAFRQRVQIVQQARRLGGRAYRAHAWWAIAALEHTAQDATRTAFITAVFAANVPRYFVRAMLAAGVHEPDLRAKRAFIAPCVASYGRRWITELLVAYRAAASRAERLGAALALYWAAIRRDTVFLLSGFVIDPPHWTPTREAQDRYAAWQSVRETRTAFLIEALSLTDDPDARRCLVEQLFGDPGVPDETLRPLLPSVRRLDERDMHVAVRKRMARLAQGFASGRATSAAALGLAHYLHPTRQIYEAFRRRCLRFVQEHGVDQIVDLDSTLFVHEIGTDLASIHEPSTRLLYVCSDPVRTPWVRKVVQPHPCCAAIQAEVLTPHAVLADPEGQRHLDWTRPLALFLLFALAFVPDDRQAHEIVQQYAQALPAGSYLVIAHATAALVQETRTGRGRSATDLAAFCTGLDLVEPGIVALQHWRPNATADGSVSSPHDVTMIGGVARKRATQFSNFGAT